MTTDVRDATVLPIGERGRPAATVRPVTFPYDGSEIGSAPVGTGDDATAAVDAALDVRAALADAPTRIRRDVLRTVRDAVADRRREFEDLLVLETGKPLADCRVEVARTLVTLDASIEEAARIHGETVPLDLLPSGDGLLGFWTRRPIGVVVAIAGFNYPLMLAAHKVGPALAAGCPVIVKPAPATPLATLHLVDLLRDAAEAAGLPRAVVQGVTGDADVGVALTTDSRIGAVSFTGSAAVGHAIAKAAAPTKVVLELGSNAALIVAADADLDAAAAAVARGGYYASGQACISVQRVLVDAAVREPFLERLTAAVDAIVVGDPRDPSTQVAALIDDAARARVRTWVDSAVNNGATRLRPSGDGGHAGDDDRLLRPTILLDVADDEPVWCEEVFGPVIAVRAVPDVDSAIEQVNASRYGLHASVFTSSLDTALTAYERLEVGGVVVNDVPGFRSDTMPYGGVKDSGMGREGPQFAAEEFTVTRMAIIRATTGGNRA